MIKVMLKEPLASGFQKAPGGTGNVVLAERVANFLLIKGKIDQPYISNVESIPPNGWLMGEEPNGNPVLIPRDNIAYIQEQLGGN